MGADLLETQGVGDRQRTTSNLDRLRTPAGQHVVTGKIGQDVSGREGGWQPVDGFGRTTEMLRGPFAFSGEPG